MRIGVTGGGGFLGWHVRAYLQSRDISAVYADRRTFSDEDLLDRFVGESDVILHVAGVNRASEDALITEGNIGLARQLVGSLVRTGRARPVLYTNSTHAEIGGVYGEAKAAASKILRTHQQSQGAPYLELILPHLFGEFGRPNYNSAITTFAHGLASGEPPQVNGDGQLELLHAQRVAERCLSFATELATGTERLSGTPISVGAVWELLQQQYTRYTDDFTIPNFAGRFELEVFNTLRSQLYLNGFYPKDLVQHSDRRGAFVELARADCLGQTSFSTSEPGVTRGDHYHFDKIERFVVLSGSATIRMRRVLSTDVSTFEVSGDKPVYIDMPPLVTHNITNTGSSTLATMFWAGDHFDPEIPDTWLDPVETQ